MEVVVILSFMFVLWVVVTLHIAESCGGRGRFSFQLLHSLCFSPLSPCFFQEDAACETNVAGRCQD